MSFIAAESYPWPYDGDLRPDNTTLIIIDMQTDFCGIGGYVDRMGYDLSLTRAPIEPIRRTLAAMRERGDFRLSVEGYEASKWIVQDYGDVVVHLFTPETREYYALEELWADAPRIDWENEE